MDDYFSILDLRNRLYEAGFRSLSRMPDREVKRVATCLLPFPSVRPVTALAAPTPSGAAPPQPTPEPYDFSTKEGTLKAIIAECRAMGLKLNTQIAYVLATVEWETAGTFKPVREAYWLSEEWRKKNLRYYPYYGRGYVQITWKENYAKYGKLLGKDLVNKPDLALSSDVALFILVHGFVHGGFTGVKITQFINEERKDFLGARKCINGTDRNHEIAQLAEKHLSSL